MLCCISKDTAGSFHFFSYFDSYSDGDGFSNATGRLIAMARMLFEVLENLLVKLGILSAILRASLTAPFVLNTQKDLKKPFQGREKFQVP